MKVMILAAGRGKRMRHLTENCPKPLVQLWGRPLIEWQILSLRKAGFKDFVVNTAYCGSQLNSFLGDGSQWGVDIDISSEGLTFEEALDTRGGIVNAMEKLCPQGADEPFAVVSGDIVTDFDYSTLITAADSIKRGECLGHFVLVPNPSYHIQGDMGLDGSRVNRTTKTHTYGNISVFSPRLFDGVPPHNVPLFPWMYQFVDQGLISGEIFTGNWANVGTPEELEKYESQTRFVQP